MFVWVRVKPRHLQLSPPRLRACMCTEAKVSWLSWQKPRDSPSADSTLLQAPMLLLGGDELVNRCKKKQLFSSKTKRRLMAESKRLWLPVQPFLAQWVTHRLLRLVLPGTRHKQFWPEMWLKLEHLHILSSSDKQCLCPPPDRLLSSPAAPSGVAGMFMLRQNAPAGWAAGGRRLQWQQLGPRCS